MLKTKCFIIGMALSLPSQAKGITYCPCPVPWRVIKEQQEKQERREQEQARRHKKHRSNKKRNRRDKKQKKVLDEIEKQNKEIIKLLNAK